MSYNTLPDNNKIQKTVEALKARGINVEVVENKEAALERIKELIPAGAPVMTGGSTTLTQIGLDDLLISGKHPWKNLKNDILAEKDPVKQGALRKQSILSDYFLGSVHAISENGEILVASATGSQLPSYAFSSKNVIWVAGAQKIVANLDEAFKRLHEHVFPLEDNRMKNTGAPGSIMGKTMIIENEPAFLQRNVTMLLVKEVLGF
ncbi:MAG: lactate utilization protein [Anaerolineae bacterium]|nr:lactate utilization protein [Anaerolineae bacterium]